MLLQLSKTVKQSPKSPQIFENNGTFCADRPFSKNRSETNCQKSFVFNQLVSELQSYILSTTTETRVRWRFSGRFSCFNRTSFQQQLKRLPAVAVPESSIWLQSYILSTTTETDRFHGCKDRYRRFNRTSFQQQLKQASAILRAFSAELQSYILSTTTETDSVFRSGVEYWLQSYILSTTTETLT